MYTYQLEGTQNAVKMWRVWSVVHKLSDSKTHIHILSDHLQSPLYVLNCKYTQVNNIHTQK